jgi:anaerobic ribonucleoside-triphosphate reductase activating protein
MQISISRLHYPVTTLGPGRRVGIWLQGCKIRCPGCVSLDTWAEDKGLTTVDEVVRAVASWLGEADGVTISGGEPFDQSDALTALLANLPLRDGQDVLVYSGYPFEQIEALPAVRQGRIDALVSDPYLVDAAQTLPLRGSDNQRLHLLTELGQLRFAEFQATKTGSGKSLDVMFDDDGSVWLAGIPRPGDMARLRSVLGAQGHEIHTTASRA